MDVRIDVAGITEIFSRARDEGRRFLYEYEVYDLIRLAGSETPPRTRLIPRMARPSDEELTGLPGERVVVKIVSPYIVHKSEVGGVRVVENTPDKVRSAWRRMVYEVAENYAALMERSPASCPKVYQGMTGTDLRAAVTRDIKGVLLCQYMPPDNAGFGNELIVSLRRTREFGMVVSAGLGGTDTELYAQRLRKGQAIVAASAEMTDAESFFELYRQTISFQKLAGLTRGARRIVTDEQLIECFGSFIALGRMFSPLNATAPFVIREMEINPFAFTDYLMVPLDGVCSFDEGGAPLPLPRPVAKVERLLRPESVAVVGVSSKKENFGRHILRNMLAAGYDPQALRVVKPGETAVDGVACVADMASLPAPTDLLVLAVDAGQIPDMVDEILERQTIQSVLLIPGGLGETAASQERARRIREAIAQARLVGQETPVFLGGNSLGIVSRPGHLDSLFVARDKLPRHQGESCGRSALVSQSGAFMLTMMNKLPVLDPAYLVSLGNQTDLTLADVTAALVDRPEVDTIAVYAEGFTDLDGLAFCRAVRAAILAGKQVVFYKAGRTPEGMDATAGHTASIAGDYMVCESCVRQAGAVVAATFTEFEDLFLLSSFLHHTTVRGKRMAGMSNAGCEAVGMADSLQGEDFRLAMAHFEPATAAAVAVALRQARLDSLVEVKNPLDVNPGASDAVFTQVARLLSADPNVDCLVVGITPYSPVLRSLAEEVGAEEGRAASLVTYLPELAAEAGKPVVAVIGAGRLYDHLADALDNARVPVFRSADRAVTALAKYVDARLHAAHIRETAALHGA